MQEKNQLAPHIHLSALHRTACSRDNALNPLLQLLHITAHDSLVQRLAVLVEHKGGHGPDLMLLSYRTRLVDINLKELDAGICLTELSNDRSNGFAGSAPCGKEIDDDGSRRDESLENYGAICWLAGRDGSKRRERTCPPGSLFRETLSRKSQRNGFG